MTWAIVLASGFVVAETKKDDQELPPGSVIDGRYIVERTIGRGSHGLIYRAADGETGESLAVKVLVRETSDDPQFAVRLWREAQALKALDSSHVVKMYRFGTDPAGLVYMAMELLDGETLEEYLSGLEAFGDRMNAYDVMRVLDPVADTLELAHEKNILHRDLKPANIFIISAQVGGGVRLLDFGLAKLLRGARPLGETQTQASLTTAGMIAGSPNYIAPEMWKSEAPDQRIDVFSFGAVIFRALAGKAPFHGATIYQLFLQVCNAERPKLTPIRKDLNPEIDAWAARALALRPNERYQTVRELWDEFVRILLAGSTPNARAAWDKYMFKKKQALSR